MDDGKYSPPDRLHVNMQTYTHEYDRRFFKVGRRKPPLCRLKNAPRQHLFQSVFLLMFM